VPFQIELFIPDRTAETVFDARKKIKNPKRCAVAEKGPEFF
jgi:hypothetical protein